MRKYEPRQALWPAQKEALRRMEGRKVFALLMAMRTGKSPVALSDFGRLELEGRVDDLLVIAAAGVYRTWVEAMGLHLSSDLLERAIHHVYRSGAGVAERRRLEEFMRRRDAPRVLLVNVEALSKAGEARLLVREFLSQRRVYVVVDESTLIKNRSKRTQFINRFVGPAAEYRRILTGLPTPRSPLDLFYQFEFLDWRILGFRNYYTFRAHAAFMKVEWFGGRRVEIVDKSQGEGGIRPEVMEELRSLIAPHSYRVEFRPNVPTTYSIRDVSMTREQERHYRELRDFATTQLGSMAHVTATVVIAKLTRMHQVLMGHVLDDEDGTEHVLPENRTAALLELLEDHGGKAVVWFTYTHDLEKVAHALREEYGPLSVARFYGGNEGTREDEEVRFKTDPSVRFMLATPGAGGKGRTWSVADLAVYYSSSDDLEKRDQSEQRTMGVKKDRGVDVVDLICRGTIEEKILQALRSKINLSSAINGDNYREWLI